MTELTEINTGRPRTTTDHVWAGGAVRDRFGLLWWPVKTNPGMQPKGHRIFLICATDAEAARRKARRESTITLTELMRAAGPLRPASA